MKGQLMVLALTVRYVLEDEEEAIQIVKANYLQ